MAAVRLRDRQVLRLSRQPRPAEPLRERLISAAAGQASERVTSDGLLRIVESGGVIRITETRAAAPVIPTKPITTALTAIRTDWDPVGLHGDWLFAPPDLVSGRDLESAVLISLFTDRLAEPSDLLPDPADGDRRGWWADWQAELLIGSRLWLISREKQTEDVRQRAEEYCREALQWKLDDDVADSVEVEAAWNPRAPGRLDTLLTVTRRRALLLKRTYSWAWGQLSPAQQGA